MKTKKNSCTFQILKFIMVFPLILMLLCVLTSCAARKKSTSVHTFIAPPPTKTSESKDNKVTIKEESVDGEIPFVVVEEMPMFPGGDAALLKYIAENVKYPEAAKNQKIQGKVIVRFCVTSKGGVALISVLRGVDPDLDAEALRVAQTLPAFKPGKQGGKDVPVWYMIPITFALK
jgi:protein TonB